MAGPGTLREVTFPLGPSLWAPLKLSRPAHGLVFFCYVRSRSSLLPNSLPSPGLSSSAK